MGNILSDRQQLEAARELVEVLGAGIDAPLAVRLWDGSRVALGGQPEPTFELAIQSAGVLGSLLRWPTADNLLRRYANGQLDIRGGSVVDFGDALSAVSRTKKGSAVSKSRIARLALPLLLARAPRARIANQYTDATAAGDTGRRRNRELIEFHYDLENANAFFPLFLDPDLLYSCAYFTSPERTLREAQQEKLELLCRKLRLREGESLLDVGCGWGGLVCYAAQNYGVRAHGITLSQAQLEFVRKRAQERGLEDRVTVERRDYRTLDGRYDKVVSVAMFEHVGVAHLQGYLDTLHRVLSPEGILVLHGITNRAKKKRRRWRRLSTEMRLTRKYLLPGLELTDIGNLIRMMQVSGFEIHDVEGLREHYERTAREWCNRLYARRKEAIALVGEQRYRLDSLCFAGMAWSFSSGSNSLYQLVASRRRPGGSPLPATRADLYRSE